MAGYARLNARPGGGLKSSRAKLGDECSQAMSTKQNARYGNPIHMALDVANKILGKCRARAHALKMGASHALAGNTAKAQHYYHLATKAKTVGVKARMAQAKELKAARAGRAPAHAEHAGHVAAVTARTAPGRGTAERMERARKIIAERKADHPGTASALSTKRTPLGIERRQAEATANRVKRNTKNVALVKEHLSKGGETHVVSHIKPVI